jgi:transcriptional regulator with XRE-family HTH domain
VKENELLTLTLQQIGERLAELRKEAGYTSYESFAYDHELPRMQYWRIEKGKVNLTIKSLLKILAIHKIGITDFFISNSTRLKRGK